MTAIEKPRDVNLDLLRIVSMLLIIFLHSIDHSGVLENTENHGVGMNFYVHFTYAMCMVCVNIYVMLSGYFMVNSKFRLHKLVSLWMEAVFYSFILKLIFMLVGKESFSVVSLVSCFFPILTGRYWFLTIYTGLYLVSPFINILIQGMDKKQHGFLNLVLFAIMSIWISIHPSIAGMNSGGGWGLAWFVVLYLAAAWLRLYYKPSYKAYRYFIIFVALPCIIAFACIVFEGGANVLVNGILLEIVKNWFRYDSVPVYIMTMCLFIGFLNIRICGKRISKLIVKIAPLMLGVYLIHAHANVSPWSWEVLNLPAKMGSVMFPVIQIISTLGIFVICAVIDLLRVSTVGKVEYAYVVNKICIHIQNKIDGLTQQLLKETSKK